MGLDNFPYPNEIFSGVYYTHPSCHDWLNKQINEENYDEFLRDAWKYIQQYQNWEIIFDINKYNFSIFRSKRDGEKYSVGHIRFLSTAINDILSIPENGNVNEFNTTLWKRKVDKYIPIWKLGTVIFPDTTFMLSINYEDFPVWFLGFDIIDENTIFIRQIQWTRISDETSTFFQKKSHFIKWFAWNKVLIWFLEDYLKNKGFSWKIILQSSGNNEYYHKKTLHAKKTTQIRANMVRIYDKAGQEMWYRGNIPGNIMWFNYSKEI